jgi:hypothetical protein
MAPTEWRGVGRQGIAQWAPIDRTKIVCLISAIRLGVSNACRVDSRRVGGTAGCPKRSRRSQQGLHIQGYRGAAARRRARDKKITDASRPCSDLGVVEGAVTADNYRRGLRRCRRGTNLLFYVRDNAGIGIRAAHNELVEWACFIGRAPACGVPNACPSATGRTRLTPEGRLSCRHRLPPHACTEGTSPMSR